MSIESQMEREEDALMHEYGLGLLSQAEYNQAMRDLHRDYREQAREAAQDAYDNELERW